MHIAARSNCSAETTADLVIAEINMRAASWADCGGRRAADLLFSLTFETLDYQAALPLPEIHKFVTNGGTLRSRRLFFYMQFQAGFWREWRKVTPTLATNRTFGCHIFHLLKATVRAFHTELNRRWIGHCGTKRRAFLYPRLPKAALIGSSCRTISGRAGDDLTTPAPVVTSDLPIKVAPSSMMRRAAFKSP